jgi:sirohydrochlorin ferrochelatase
MKTCLLLVVVLASSAAAPSAQGKRVLVVEPFTLASGVELPYDVKQLQAGLVADLRVQIGKEFEVVSEAPTGRETTVYTLIGEITGWRPGNAAKRIFVGLGSGREASDIHYRVADNSGQNVIDRTDTIRTNFYSQGAGSVGTLVHPIAQKIAERIKDAKLK